MAHRYLVVVAFLALSVPIASGQSDQREELVRRITSAYSNAVSIDANSPLVDHLLRPAKSANPQVNEEQWKSVKIDVASAFNGAMQRDGGPLGAAVQTALADFTISDLSKLASLLEDPIYKHFQSVMSSPAVQQQMLASQSKMALQLNLTVNTVLSNHGLKEVH